MISPPPLPSLFLVFPLFFSCSLPRLLISFLPPLLPTLPSPGLFLSSSLPFCVHSLIEPLYLSLFCLLLFFPSLSLPPTRIRSLVSLSPLTPSHTGFSPFLSPSLSIYSPTPSVTYIYFLCHPPCIHFFNTKESGYFISTIFFHSTLLKLTKTRKPASSTLSVTVWASGCLSGSARQSSCSTARHLSTYKT